MLTTLLLLTILAAPDAGHTPDALTPDAARAMATALERAFDDDVAVDALLATRQGQRIVNSALLCRSVEDLLAEGQSTAAARRRLAAVGVAATGRLEAARIAPLDCGAWPVERLTQCLGLLPSAACTEDDELAAQVRAAMRLEVQP
jgi:hypothetical protein